jgi:hypothetical protein
MPDTMMTEEPIAAQPTWELTARSPQLGELFAAVAKAQGEIEGAKKDSTNPHFKSKYADLASARDAVQGPLSKNGLALIQWPRTVNNGVEIETWLGHASGQYMSGTLCMPCSKMDAHGVGSAITYGRRYALMAVTGVAPEDDDGNGAADGHRPGLPGSAGGGTQFRPEQRRMPTKNYSEDARHDGIVDETRQKGTLPGKAPTNGKVTPAEREAKLKAATDKRIKALKDGPWTSDSLKEFWEQEADWREWMGDPANDALGHYERFTTAYTEAQDAL